MGKSNLKYLTNNEKRALEELKRKVLSINPEAKLILFGSKVRGDFDEESDVDVLIVIPDLTKKEKKEIFKIYFNLNLKYDINITATAVDKNLFLSDGFKFSAFYRNLKEEGIFL